MNGGTVFVLLLAVGFLTFVVYMAILSRRSRRAGDERDQHRKDPAA